MISSLHVTKGEEYSIIYYAKTTAEATASFTMCTGDVCSYSSQAIKKSVSAIAVTYVAPADGAFRLVISVGGAVGTVTIYNVSMAAGGCVGLQDSETIDTTRVLPKNNADTTQKKTDRDVFLAVLENRFFEGLRTYIKGTLGYPGLVTGTINFGPLALYSQARMDFIDMHLYWSHPTFPSTPWSSTDWIVNQNVMALNPQKATFWSLIKANGKPYTITEYNHAAPADSQAETIPMIATWAALQDIDGVFIFAYAHGNHFSPSLYRMNGYFDIDYNPVKWTMMKNAALIYCKGLLPPLAPTKVLDFAEYSSDIESNVLPKMLRLQGMSGFLSKFWENSTYEDWIRTRVSYNYGYWPKVQPEVPKDSKKDPAVVHWDDASGFSIATTKAIVFSGNTTSARMQEYEWGTVDISSPSLATLTVAPYDGKRLNRSEKIVVVLAGRVENTGMKWKDETWTSVSNNWGSKSLHIYTHTIKQTNKQIILMSLAAPPRCEVSTGTLKLKGIALQGTSCAWTPLDSKGLEVTESEKIVVANENGVVLLETSPATIWYSLKCNRTGYTEEPEESSESNKPDTSSSLCVQWVLIVLATLFAVML